MINMKSNLNKEVFKQAKEIPWLQGKTVRKGQIFNDLAIDWTIPVAELFLGNDWYLEKYKIFDEAPENSVIVDAGCKHGDWTYTAKHILPSNTIKIGADPIYYNTIDGAVDFYHQCAIDDVNESTELTFHVFDEPGCNSLLNKSEHLIMRNVLNTITVPVRSLESILLEHVNSDSLIYYVKCDCQGKDTDVIRSLKSFLPNTKYVQIESAFSYDKLFYDGQPSYEDDIRKMDELGFEPIFYMEYLESPLPEGEILFKNKNL